MSKQMIVTLPFALLLLDVVAAEALQDVRTLVLEKVPLIALAIAASIITFFAQRKGGAVQSLASMPLAARAAITPWMAYVAYLRRELHLAHRIGLLLPISLATAHRRSIIRRPRAGCNVNVSSAVIPRSPIPSRRMVLVSRNDGAGHRIDPGRPPVASRSLHLHSSDRDLNHGSLGRRRSLREMAKTRKMPFRLSRQLLYA